MERVDMYLGVHKGIRRMLASLGNQAGTTDFAQPAQVASLEKAMVRAFELIESHGHHEDAHVMPLVLSHHPELVSTLDDDHHRHGEQFASLLERIRAIRDARATSSRAGHELVVALSRVVGELYEHMADEEEKVQPLLWRLYDDATLARVTGELVGSIPPEELRDFHAWMIPAMNEPERAGFMRNVAENAPREAYEGVVELARSVLSTEDAQRLSASLAS